MKQPIIACLNNVTQPMIDSLELWLSNGYYDSCPFKKMAYMCEKTCSALFEDYSVERTNKCPCYYFGQEATILAFTIICDVWKVYHKEAK